MDITYKELEDQVSEGKFDSEYMDFMVENCSDRIYGGDGDAYLVAQESGQFFDEFVEYLFGTLFKEVAAWIRSPMVKVGSVG